MIDYREIENLIKALDKSSLTGIEIGYEGVQINMTKEKVVYVNDVSTPIHQNNEVKQTTLNIEATDCAKERDKNIKAIKSPIVGTFYSKPAPDKDSYLSVGENVKKDQIVCIIEAMKLMNEVKSEFSGEVVEILVTDGELIEYGQEIFLVKES
ncbi:MAG: acetyl-CoA carboxylase biotin carboxyl carrier protein [Clostridium sp.]